MENVADIKVRQTIVGVNSHSRDVWATIAKGMGVVRADFNNDGWTEIAVATVKSFTKNLS